MRGHFCRAAQPLCKVRVAPAPWDHHPSHGQQHPKWGKISHFNLSGTELGTAPRSHDDQPCSAHHISQPRVENHVYLVACLLRQDEIQKGFLHKPVGSCRNVVLLPSNSTHYGTKENGATSRCKAKTTPPSLDFLKHNFFPLKFKSFLRICDR